jgi:hypothetical protein
MSGGQLHRQMHPDVLDQPDVKSINVSHLVPRFVGAAILKQRGRVVRTNV